MKKTHQPESAGKTQDLQVEPLTAEEIQQVSGGGGSGRLSFVNIQPSSGRQGATLGAGKAFHFAS
ncbi:hypothetical protein [Achromobacter pestifer]|uniref:Uncharacterized protein n=1 Tax=Achromobacter pestifer TaxID=1353889 RepID=A0A6S6Z526_9BURK|nr:hypothetical protein [Achromobacter pestifer]CAB3654835.1 hypothetical protein LMG3431_03043 [Achromobacter pestifer]